MDGAVYVYPHYRSPIALFGNAQRACPDAPNRCATAATRALCPLPLGPWKLDSARYPFDKAPCFSAFCTPSIHRLSVPGSFHRPESCYSLHTTAAGGSSFVPTYGPPIIQPRLLQTHQQYLPDNKHALGASLASQKLPPAGEPFPSLLPMFTDSLAQLNYGRKVFPCPQCRYTTDRRNNLKRHMLTMHQACSKLLECCGILFTTKASLREHAMIFHYHGYTCFYCGRRFCRKALLKRHLSVHNGQKDFVCSVCDYATSHKSNLERHRKVHARQDDSKENSSAKSRDRCAGNPEDSTGDDDVFICTDDEEVNVLENS